MRIAVFGAGAIGCYVGARLAQAGCDVTLIARGPQLAALRASGVRLIDAQGHEQCIPVPACAEGAARGPFETVFVAVKAHQLRPGLAALAPLLAPDTAAVTAQNGVPWWYFHALEGPWRERRIPLLDPDGALWQTIRPERVAGCVVYPAAELVAPGRVRIVSAPALDRFALGAPDGRRPPRLAQFSAALIAAGFKAPLVRDIRTEIWVKLLGNLAFNPVSALTGASLHDMAADPRIRTLIAGMMSEGMAVAERLGQRLPVSIEQRIEGAGRVGAHIPSMRQDLEHRRAVEIDAITGAVAELGRLVGVATPLIDALYALVRQKAERLGCYPAPLN